MCVYNIHIYPILYVGDTLYICMYIYDIWGIHCEKDMYTYDVKHTYTIYMYTLTYTYDGDEGDDFMEC